MKKPAHPAKPSRETGTRVHFQTRVAVGEIIPHTSHAAPPTSIATATANVMRSLTTDQSYRAP